ncbi:MAG: sterol desaturase family protein, partial [Enterobacterales bacterium]|nr:sterol desaturase family protein [Enterobacterales bacterium]
MVYAKLEALSGLLRWPSDSIITWVVAFIVYDLLYYWFHRTSHEINFLWASHVVHHQSEDYNLSTALRQTSSSIFGWLFYIPSFLIGIPAEVFFVCGALNLVYQFWVHTQLVGRLGWLELLLVTPSHHRVHHGQNPEYIDKNHGGVFIFWDKMFGTFQQEIDNLPVIYGVRSSVNSFNPLWLNFKTWHSLVMDAWLTNSWWDKIRIWFMPTGWRPADCLLVDKTDRVATSTEFVAPHKYNPKSSALIKGYL